VAINTKFFETRYIYFFVSINGGKRHRILVMNGANLTKA
jgi:hypothetical protein